MLDKLPSSEGMVPANLFTSKTIQNKNIKVNLQPSTLKKSTAQTACSLYNEVYYLRRYRCFRLDKLPISDGIIPAKPFLSKMHPKQNVKVNIKNSRKEFSKTHAVFITVLGWITHVARLLLGSTSFRALMGLYLSNHSHLKRIRDKYIKVNIKPERNSLHNGLEVYYLQRASSFRLNKLPSSDGILPIK